MSREVDEANKPELLTVTEINNPSQKYKRHFNIWYFIKIDKNNFKPDTEKLAKEFYTTCWLDLDSARELVTDLNNRQALSVIQKKFEV